MKTTTLSITALLCVSLSYAQEKKLNQNIQLSSFGSFGAVKAAEQAAPEITFGSASAVAVNNTPYKHSTFKTSDGGTATFVKFNAKTTKAPIINTASKKANAKIIKNAVKDITIFPNPTNGVFTVQMDNVKWLMANGNTSTINPQSSTIEVYNMYGACIHRQICTSANQQIDLSTQAKGIYFVKVISGSSVYTDKIIIQ